MWDVCRPILELGPETVIPSLYWRAIESLARTKVRGLVPYSAANLVVALLSSHKAILVELTLFACTSNYTVEYTS